MEPLAKSRATSTPIILGAILILAACLLAGALFYYFVEGLSFVDALYFASMTLTTVGYGDFVPTTVAGKIFTSIYAFVGIGTFFGCAALLFQAALVRIHKLHVVLKTHLENEQKHDK